MRAAKRNGNVRVPTKYECQLTLPSGGYVNGHRKLKLVSIFLDLQILY